MLKLYRKSRSFSVLLTPCLNPEENKSREDLYRERVESLKQQQKYVDLLKIQLKSKPIVQLKSKLLKKF